MSIEHWWYDSRVRVFRGYEFWKGVEIMNRVIFYKTATCPSCGKVVTFAMDEKRGTVCRCMGVEKAMEPGNEVKAIIVKEVAR